MDAIENVYQLLKYFRDLESQGYHVGKEMEGLRACLIYLQKQEGTKIREKTEKELRKLQPGLEIIKGGRRKMS